MILLLGTAAYVSFLLIYEGWAIATHHETITEHVRDIEKVWGLFGPLLGLVVGGLMVHFFWLEP